jgi:replicative DNA helicase
VNRIAALFDVLIRRQVRKVPRPLGEILAERVDRITGLLAGDIEPGWPTRIHALDRMLNGGLRPGMLYVLAARPSVGKSSFAASLSITLARQGLPVLLLSQEMTGGEIGDRIIASMAGIDYGAIQHGDLDDAAWQRLSEAVDHGASLPVHVDDQAGLRLVDIQAKARLVKGLRVLVLDYLQLSASTRRDGNRNAEIEEISRGLKALAKDMNIAVIELSQLNRAVETRADKRPVLSDLRDSGAIEQDADAVLLMWPVRHFENEGRHIIGLGVAKNRQGQRGEIGLDFHGASQRWGESTADIRTAPPSRWNQQGGEL